MRIHTNENPYECDFCDKVFRDSSDLKKHVRTHTNERPYECDVCEKRFRQSHHLQSHKLIHRNETYHRVLYVRESVFVDLIL